MYIKFSKVRIQKIYFAKSEKHKEFINPKYQIFFIKHYFFLVFVATVEVKVKNIYIFFNKFFFLLSISTTIQKKKDLKATIRITIT